MRFGTIIELPDERRATVVYHGLVGYGVVFGEHHFDADQVQAAMSANPLFGERPPDYPIPEYEALLREKWKTAPDGIEYVGEEYKVVYEPEH